MKYTIALAIAALAAVASAAPAQKRDIVWVTDYKEVVETTIVVTTVYVPAPVGTIQAAAATATPAAASTHDAPDEANAGQAVAAANPNPAPVSSAVAVAPVPAVTSSAAQASVADTPVPAPSSSAVDVAAPSVTPAPSPAASSPPTSAPSEASSAGGPAGTTYSGDGTFYDVGLGSCGLTSSPDDMIVALSVAIMSSANSANPNNNPYCGRKININYQGQTAEATVVDTCQGCAMDDIDMSDGLFSKLTGGDFGLGRLHGVQWSFAS